MKMVDMKLSKSPKKEGMGVVMPEAMKDEYPYGLRISLDKDQIEKLGFDGNVGDEVIVHAMGTITSKSENNVQGGKKEKRLEIQIKNLSCKECMKDMEMDEYEELRKPAKKK